MKNNQDQLDHHIVQKHGGSRLGAGRKQGSGAFKEPTVVKRIPASLAESVDDWLLAHKTRLQLSSLKPPLNNLLPDGARAVVAQASLLKIPLASDPVRAGFPSPAAPYAEDYLDFNQYLVQHPSATLAIYAKGDSMNLAGIDSGDMLVVDRALEPKINDIVVAEVNGDFTVKRMVKGVAGIELHAQSNAGPYPNIVPGASTDIKIVGVITHIIKSTR